MDMDYNCIVIIDDNGNRKIIHPKFKGCKDIKRVREYANNNIDILKRVDISGISWEEINASNITNSGQQTNFTIHHYPMGIRNVVSNYLTQQEEHMNYCHRLAGYLSGVDSTAYKVSKRQRLNSNRSDR